jgi:hypothetical protein
LAEMMESPTSQSYSLTLQELIDAKQYEQAYEHSLPQDKALIARLFADQLYQSAQYSKAAQVYVDSDYSFEYITLRLVELKQKKPLIEFLQSFVGYLSAREKKVMVGSWILELLLEEIDLLKASNVESSKVISDWSVDDVLGMVKSHLKRADVLDKSIVTSLLKQHGHVQLLLSYLTFHKDWTNLIQILLEQKQWNAALDVVGRQSDPTLYYRHSTILVQNIPKETIALWKKCPFLNPRLLMPAMLHCTSLDSSLMLEIISYLEEVVESGNTDQLIHNFMLQLYADSTMTDKMDRIMSFITSREHLFDARHALRLFLKHKLNLPVVHMYISLKMYKEAVKFALEVS